jgi:hypothetical protein
MKIVVRSNLYSTTHSPANRSKARELAWIWVRAKWPRLLPSEAQMALVSFERALPGQELLVRTSGNEPDGPSTWSLSVAHTQRASVPTQRASTRTWMTRVQVIDTGTTDELHLQTACTDIPESPLVVAPPRLLSDWVEALDLQDGGLAVQGSPREVVDRWQLDALCTHLLCTERKLPVIALVNRPQTHYYGVDPQGLAENLRGLAHVACIASHLEADILSRLGCELGVEQGAARIYTAGFSPNADRRAHPLVRDASPRGEQRKEDPGAFRRLLCRKICALSVEAVANTA